MSEDILSSLLVVVCNPKGHAGYDNTNNNIIKGCYSPQIKVEIFYMDHNI